MMTHEARQGAVAEFALYQPGPHYVVTHPSGERVADPCPLLDSPEQARQHQDELAAEGIETTGSVITELLGGYWLARCSVCGAEAHDIDRDGVKNDFAEVVAAAAEANRDQQQCRIARYFPVFGSHWFVHLQRQDLRCENHLPRSAAGWVPADVVEEV